MKKIVIISLLNVLLACNNKTKKALVDSTFTKPVVNKIDLSKAQPDTGVLKPSEPIDNSDSNALAKRLIGMWTQKDSEGNVVFEIRKSVFYYPEHFKSYPYTMTTDSLKIKYNDFSESFAYKFKDANTLILTGEDGESVYNRKM